MEPISTRAWDTCRKPASYLTRMSTKQQSQYMIRARPPGTERSVVEIWIVCDQIRQQISRSILELGVSIGPIERRRGHYEARAQPNRRPRVKLSLDSTMLHRQDRQHPRRCHALTIYRAITARYSRWAEADHSSIKETLCRKRAWRTCATQATTETPITGM